MNMNPKQEKIVRVSRVIRTLLLAGLAMWAVCIPLVLLASWLPFLILPKQTIHGSTTYLVCGSVVLIALAWMVNLKLFRFFDRLKNGFLFDAQTVGNLGAAGRWWVALWLFQVIFYQIGDAFFHLKMEWTTGNLFAGLILIFVGWLLEEAQNLQAENELTV